MNLAELAKNFSTEESAIRYLEGDSGPMAQCVHTAANRQRFRDALKERNQEQDAHWPVEVLRMPQDLPRHSRHIFEDSHIPLHKWMMAIHLMCASKKGISAHQLHRMLGIGYRAAGLWRTASATR